MTMMRRRKLNLMKDLYQKFQIRILTNEVQQAIISAFYCGLEAQHDFIVKQCRNTRSINDQKQFEIEI